MEKTRNTRIFIAGHVFGLTDPERAEIRQKMTDAYELFGELGFDVVNPVDMMDEKGDRNDLLCRYYRALMDCSSVVLYDDHAIYEECQTAGAMALIRGMCIWRENENLILHDIVRPVILGIMHAIGLMVTDYAGVKSRAENVIMARALFAHYCRERGMQNRDIGNCLHGCNYGSAKTIGSKLNEQYYTFIKVSKDFGDYNDIMADYLKEYDKRKR